MQAPPPAGHDGYAVGRRKIFGRVAHCVAQLVDGGYMLCLESLAALHAHAYGRAACFERPRQIECRSTLAAGVDGPRAVDYGLRHILGGTVVVGIGVVTLGPVHELACAEAAGRIGAETRGGAAGAHVVEHGVAVAVVGNRHIFHIFRHEGVLVAAGAVEKLAVVPQARHGGYGAPEGAALRRKADMFRSIPAYTLHAGGFKFFHIGFYGACTSACSLLRSG